MSHADDYAWFELETYGMLGTTDEAGPSRRQRAVPALGRIVVKAIDEDGDQPLG